MAVRMTVDEINALIEYHKANSNAIEKNMKRFDNFYRYEGNLDPDLVRQQMERYRTRLDEAEKRYQYWMDKYQDIAED